MFVMQDVLLSVLSTESNKKLNLSVLCVSAVNHYPVFSLHVESEGDDITVFDEVILSFQP